MTQAAADNGRIHIPGAEGMEQTDSGLYVPTGTDTTPSLTSLNDRLLGLRETLGTKDLIKKIQLEYLTATSTDDNGVTRWGEDSDMEASDAAEFMMNRFEFHLHRYAPAEGMTPELYAQLQGVTDNATGKSYAMIVTKASVGFDKRTLENMLTKSGVTYDEVSKLAGQGAYTHHSKVAGEILDKEFGQDSDKFRAGIKNLQAVKKVGMDVTDEIMSTLGVQQLTQSYVGMIGEYHTEQDSKKPGQLN